MADHLTPLKALPIDQIWDTRHLSIFYVLFVHVLNKVPIILSKYVYKESKQNSQRHKRLIRYCQIFGIN